MDMSLFKAFKKLYYSEETQSSMLYLNRALVVIAMASSGNHVDSESCITGALRSVLMP